MIKLKQPKVSQFFNDNFVSAMLNPDNTMDNLLVSTWGATSVPTFMFFNKDKKLVYSIAGYADEDRIIQEAEIALKMMKEGKTIKDMKKETKEADDDDDDDDAPKAKKGKKAKEKDDE